MTFYLSPVDEKKMHCALSIFKGIGDTGDIVDFALWRKLFFLTLISSHVDRVQQWKKRETISVFKLKSGLSLNVSKK